MDNKYLMVDTSILPSSYLDVIHARDMIEEENISIAEACRRNNISRSTYYKYHDLVFLPPKDSGKKASLSLLVDDVPGTLSNVLETVYLEKGNVLTIDQTMPLQRKATISITLDTKKLMGGLDSLLGKLKAKEHVKKVEVIAYE